MPYATLKGRRAASSVPDVIFPAEWLCELAAAPNPLSVIPRLLLAVAASDAQELCVERQEPSVGDIRKGHSGIAGKAEGTINKDPVQIDTEP